MALFTRKRAGVTSDGAELSGDALWGRALILGMSVSGATVRSGDDRTRLCTIDLDVWLDDVPRFRATAVKNVPEYILGQLAPGESVVAVRVAPDDHARVAVDFAVAPPVVRVAPEASQRAAAEIIALGTPCEVVVVETKRLGMLSPTGVELYAFVLTVLRKDLPPYQTSVGMPVPPAAVPLLYPGSRTTGMYLPEGDEDDVTIDWDTTLLNATWEPQAPVEMDREWAVTGGLRSA